MKQSLPGIATIHTVECASLMPNMMLRAQCNLPNAVFTDAVQVDLIGTPSLKNETKYNNGGYSESAALEYVTTVQPSVDTPLAFIVKCVNGDTYLLGTREKPYPVVKTTKTTGTPDSEASVYKVEISYLAPKTLIPIKF